MYTQLLRKPQRIIISIKGYIIISIFFKIFILIIELKGWFLLRKIYSFIYTVIYTIKLNDILYFVDSMDPHLHNATMLDIYLLRIKQVCCHNKKMIMY